MKFNLSSHVIANLIRCPEPAVRDNWPLIENALVSLLQLQGYEYTPSFAVAILATIAVETAWTFKPIEEHGTRDYFSLHYDYRKDLGNSGPGDGFKYRGRGFIQRTGKANYQRVNDTLGVDAVGNPDLLLDPVVSAADCAHYFVIERPSIRLAANQSDWPKVRKLVNGGLNGYQDFIGCVTRLRAALPNPTLVDTEGGTQ